MSTSDTLDMTVLLEVLDELRGEIESLNGSRVNIEVRSKQVNAEKAEINRKLLYVAHLFDAAKVEVMSQYHRFKGEDPPFLQF